MHGEETLGACIATGTARTTSRMQGRCEPISSERAMEQIKPVFKYPILSYVQSTQQKKPLYWNVRHGYLFKN